MRWTASGTTVIHLPRVSRPLYVHCAVPLRTTYLPPYCAHPGQDGLASSGYLRRAASQSFYLFRPDHATDRQLMLLAFQMLFNLTDETNHARSAGADDSHLCCSSGSGPAQ